MARAAADLSGWEKIAQLLAFDTLRVACYGAHLAIVGYVSLGWLIPSRVALYAYTLLLPLIAIHWLLNGGVSLVNNVENLLRTGRWNDPENVFEGAFFKTLLAFVGVRATQAQIATVLCVLMAIFWTAALCHMILIVP